MTRQKIDGVVKSGERRNVVGNHDDFAAPTERGVTIRAIDGKDKFGARANGRSDFSRIQAVDRDAMACLTKRSHVIANIAPRFARFASDIDQVCAAGTQLVCLEQDFRHG